MKSEDYPIKIDGKDYEVDRTFSGEPAVYKILSEEKMKHINSNTETMNIRSLFGGVKEEDGFILILARVKK
jgi:hypothetical protein